MFDGNEVAVGHGLDYVVKVYTYIWESILEMY